MLTSIIITIIIISDAHGGGSLVNDPAGSSCPE